MDDSADGVTVSAMESLSVGATASKPASGRKAGDIKSEFREVLGERAFCKQCVKPGIIKGEGDDMVMLVTGRKSGHSGRHSAQLDCSSCPWILWSTVDLVHSFEDVYIRQQLSI